MTDPIFPLQQVWEQAESFSRREGRPWVTLSYAQSLDGSIAARRGKHLPVSGEAALEITHRLRAAHQAILVGVGTALSDDPRLDVRLVPGQDPQAVILDSQLRFPHHAALFARGAKPWILTTEAAPLDRQEKLIQAGARVFRHPPDANGHVPIPAALETLGSLGITTLMVEGGAQIITGFLQAHRVEFIVLTVAPYLVGGLRAIGQSLGDIESENPCQDFPRLSPMEMTPLGQDVIVSGRAIWPQEL
jgi:3,4-dihydroxy 2-butanone 4-phosphate synthase/GTP cyclohydrolase II